MAIHFKRKEGFVSPAWYIAVFPLIVLYYEIVFRASTVGGVFRPSALVMLLFSLSCGCIGYLLVTLITNRKALHITASVVIALTAVPYLIEYFVYRQFNIFYDFETVVGGAGDVMGGFMTEIGELLFCWDGILKLLLFFLPTVLYAVFANRVFANPSNHNVGRIVAALVLVFGYGFGLVAVRATPAYYAAYKLEYNYQSVVGEFGLMTGLRLDLQKLIFGADGDFEETDQPVVPPEETEQVPKEYPYNQVELDLSQTTGKIGELNTYVSSLTPSRQNEYTGLFKGKNLIMITAEAFTKEVIDPVRTPTLYRLANKGIQFKDYYQPSSAGTTGGEYQNVFGMLPTAGGKSFKNTADNNNYMTIGSQLNRLGYYGKAFHNNSYTYYSRNETHVNLGYSDGFMGYGNGMEQYVKNVWPQSDLEMFEGTLPTYIDRQPFNVYYMTVSGHSGYSLTGNSMTKRNWDSVADLPYSETIRGYYAANMELEKAMAYLVAELEAKGIADDTVICISTDHFPYGLDAGGKLGAMPYLSELYGYDVNTVFERDHSALILWSGCLEDNDPIVVESPTFSLDILPTLSNLFGTEFDSRLLVGRDVFSDAEALVFTANYDWKTDLGTYYSSGAKFVPNEGVEIPEGYVDRIKKTVRNKVKFCSGVLDNDYYRHLFK